MNSVIAVIAQKGGTGKTTTAISLAVAAQLAGRTAAIIDIDSQQTASRWADRRAVDSPAVVSAQSARLPQVIAAAKENGADLVIIDTPPRAERAAMDAVRAADFVLIPCRPSIFDIETIKTTLDLVAAAGSKPMAAMLNGVRTRGKKRDQAEQVLQELNVAVLPAALGIRAVYDHAAEAGLSAQEYEPSGKAATEITNVYMSICRLVDMSTETGGIGDEDRLAASNA